MVIKAKVKEFLVKITSSLLNHPEIESRIWEIVNRPSDRSVRPHNILHKQWEQAAEETADYVTRHMLSVPSFTGRYELFETALANVKNPGLYLEFGAGWQAKSINFLAERIDGVIHGFDSFEGLPEAWFGDFGKGSLCSSVQALKFRDNIRIHKGLFSETLPEFIETFKDEVAFIHIDCDIYSSAKTIFDILDERINTGTVIQFDEYFNYPGWQHHEFKAFQEFIDRRKLQYSYLGFDRRNFAVAVVIN